MCDWALRDFQNSGVSTGEQTTNRLSKLDSCFFQEWLPARVKSERRASKTTAEETPFFIREKGDSFDPTVLVGQLALQYPFVSEGCQSQDTWDGSLHRYMRTSLIHMWISSRWRRIPDTMEASCKWLLDCGPQGLSPRKRDLCMFSTDTNLFPGFLDLLVAGFISVEPRVMEDRVY